MIIKNGRVFQEEGGADGFLTEDILLRGESILKKGRLTEEDMRGEEILDASGCYVIPGLIDVHLHGCVHRDFSGSTAQEMEPMLEYQAAQGVTAVCPATMTLPEQTLRQAMGAMSEAGCERGAALVGINMEGPFLSHGKLGAQNPAYIQEPDLALFRRLQESCGGLIKLLAIAPELPGAMELIEALRGEVACSVAHTTADYNTAAVAFARGARHVTHLYNAMPPFSHRNPSVVGAALDSQQVTVELICDNVHIHPSAIRATFQMFGDDRIVLVSDSMMATGLDDGEYELGGLPVLVSGNRAVLKEGGAIAGSVTNLMKCVRLAVTEMGIPLHSAVKCASVNPAKAIGVSKTRGGIVAGKTADLVLLKENLDVEQVILRGKPLRR